MRGTARKALGHLGAAISDMDTVLRVDPGYYEAYIQRGKLLHYLQQRWEQAIDDLTAAIEHGIAATENARECFYLRGMAAQELGDHRAAITDFTRTIDLIPSDGGAYLRRWRSYCQIGESALAGADFEVGKRLIHSMSDTP